eukprot:CAMPEP_0116992324 /NCGR_PEP_ID=MMETSP0467-20121206/66726_1 /TAXON_ID=283647 /ORGANISM="Mesodinium pulex, Strain SPMC105" /LENGTH=80 /DNA_ID=CAMNT_0004689697 /DNA_START=181 /DNA_END=423 /DNA_ORIENTATION=+
MQSQKEVSKDLTFNPDQNSGNEKQNATDSAASQLNDNDNENKTEVENANSTLGHNELDKNKSTNELELPKPNPKRIPKAK